MTESVCQHLKHSCVHKYAQIVCACVSVRVRKENEESGSVRASKYTFSEVYQENRNSLTPALLSNQEMGS